MSRNLIARVVSTLAAAILATSAFAQTTLFIKNSTATATSAGVTEVTPVAGNTQVYTLNTDQSQNTNLPANGNTLINLQMRQNNANVAGTPLLITNVRQANLNSSCNPDAAPCLYLTPAVALNNAEVKQANAFLAARNPNKQFCLSGSFSKRSGALYFTLANGLVVRLLGNLHGAAESGQGCLCGAMALPPQPLDTIAFEVRGPCVKKKH